MEDADYVVLGRRENIYFDFDWDSAQEHNKPTVTPNFVLHSYDDGKLKDPNDYKPTGPMKPKKPEPKARPSKGVQKPKAKGDARVATLRPKPHREAPNKPKKSSGALTSDAKATRLEHVWAKTELPNEGLVKTEPQNEGLVKTEPQDEGLAKTEPQNEGLVKTEPQNEGLVKTEPQNEGLAKAEPQNEGLVKTEPSDEESDFEFAVNIFAHWNAMVESNAALWERMETTVRSLLFPSGFLVR